MVSSRDPLQLPWKEMDIDLVIEGTGVFVDSKGAGKHIEVGQGLGSGFGAHPHLTARPPCATASTALSVTEQSRLAQNVGPHEARFCILGCVVILGPV